MKTTSAKAVALGGVLAALALVIQCLGGLIPVATFVVPTLCMILGSFVLRCCGSRIAWAWYGAVAALSFLMGPDKEAAMLFVFLGYYPIIKPKLDRLPLRWLWKLLLFNISVAVMYVILIFLLGMNQLAGEYMELGIWGLVITLIMGNITFYLLDAVLDRCINGKFRKRPGR